MRTAKIKIYFIIIKVSSSLLLSFVRGVVKIGRHLSGKSSLKHIVDPL